MQLHVTNPQHETPQLVVDVAAQSFFRRDDGGAVFVDDGGPAVVNVKAAGLGCRVQGRVQRVGCVGV